MIMFMKKLRILSLIIAFIVSAVPLMSCGGDSEESSGPDEKKPAVTAVSNDTEPVDVTDTKEQKISFFAAGDNIIHECVYLDAMTVAASTGSASQYAFSGMYDNIRDTVEEADIAFINAEGPLDTDYAPNGYPTFNAPGEAGDALADVGFDVINLANNHMLDFYCETGLQATISYWKAKGMTTVGAYESVDDYNSIRVIEKNGMKAAILSYTYGTNGNSLPAGCSLYIPYIDDAEITRQIAEAKNLADAVIVSMHWGTENEMSANAEQQRLAHLISDAGADVIIGHHSHTIQPIEWMTGAYGNRTLVIYSLGNLLHTQINPANLVGGTVTFDILPSEGGGVTVDNVVFRPTVCHYVSNSAILDSLDYSKRENVKIYWLSDYTEELASEHGCQHGNWDCAPFSLETLKGYVRNTVSSEFLPEGFN